MALKVLLLRQKLSAKQKELSELRTLSENFITRETELETAITEAMTDEERSTVENLVTAFEAERDTNTTDIERVSGEIADIENEIAEVEKATGTARAKPVNGQERTKTIMENAETRTHFFGMTVRERDDFIARDDVKDFTKRMRELNNQNRGVTGAELGIPTIMLDILRSNIDQYSKLMKYVRLRKLSGKARQSICGVVPEAVWTEATGALNDLDVVFTQVEVDGYKLGGYLAIPNSLIEDDDDVQLLMEVMVQMGQAIGKGVDKSIVYGDGVKMPVGFATRLAATSKPAWWGSNQGAFTDLHLSNVKKLSIAASSGVNFFRSLITELGIADPEYSVSENAVWLMNRKTHIDIMCRALEFNASATLVAGMQNTMPIVGGDIIELNFMKDFDIAGGFLDLMLLVERSGSNIRSSDIPMMVQDQTVVVATQRYDGKPMRGEAFMIVSYDNTDPNLVEEFEYDYANTEFGMLGVSCAAGTASGKTKIAITNATAGAVLKAKVGANIATIKIGQKPGTTWAEIATGGEVVAVAGSVVSVVELDAEGKAVKLGSAYSVPMA